MIIALLFCIINILDFSTNKTTTPVESPDEKSKKNNQKNKGNSSSNSNSSILCLSEPDSRRHDDNNDNKCVGSIQMDVNYYSMDSLDYYNYSANENVNSSIKRMETHSENDDQLITWTKLKKLNMNKTHQYRFKETYKNRMNSQGDSLLSIDSIIDDNSSNLSSIDDGFILSNKSTQTMQLAEHCRPHSALPSTTSSSIVADKPIWIFYPNYTLPNLDFLYKNNKKLSTNSNRLSSLSSPSLKSTLECKQRHFDHIQDWDSLNILLPEEYKNLNQKIELNQYKNDSINHNCFLSSNHRHSYVDNDDDDDDEGVDAGNSSTTSSSSLLDMDYPLLEGIIHTNDELKQLNDYLKEIDLRDLDEEYIQEPNQFYLKSYIRKFMQLKINERHQIVRRKIEKKSEVRSPNNASNTRKLKQQQQQQQLTDGLELPLSANNDEKYKRKSTTSRIPLLIAHHSAAPKQKKTIKSKIPRPIRRLQRKTPDISCHRYVKTLNYYQPLSENGYLPYKRNEQLQIVDTIDDRWLLCCNRMKRKGLVRKSEVITVC